MSGWNLIAEKKIQALEARVTELNQALADPALYGGDAAGVQKAVTLKAELARVQGALEKAVERWMEAEGALEA